MKAKFFIATLLIAGASLSMMAQGYKDGIEFYKIADYENARVLLERNLDDASTNKSEAYYYLGMIALQQKDNALAKSYFDKGVAASPNYPYNYVGQGALALKAGGDAKKLFDQARKLSKKDAKLEVAIARAYYNANPATYAKDIEKCIKQARKYNQNDPDSYIFEADQYTDQMRWGDAAGNYELAYTLDPANIEAYVKYADTYYKENPDYALDRLEEIIDKAPNSALVQRQLAEKLYEGGKLAKAAQRYGSYISGTKNHFPKDEARYCQLLLAAGEYAKCAEMAQKLKGTLPAGDPYRVVADRLALYGFAAAKDWNNAAEAGRSLFADAGGNFEANDYVFYARALDNIGDAAGAMAAYDKAVQLDPSNLDLIRGLAKSASAAGDFNKALTYGQKVLDATNRGADDLYDMADVYFQNAKKLNGEEKTLALNGGLDYINEALGKDANNIAYLYRKALIEREKDTDTNAGNAVDTYLRLAQVVETSPNRDELTAYLPVAYSYVGTYYVNNKRMADAVAVFKKWLAIEPDNQSLKEFIQQFDK